MSVVHIEENFFLIEISKRIDDFESIRVFIDIFSEIIRDRESFVHVYSLHHFN